MAEVTADDIDVLAKAGEDDAVLALVDGQIVVAPEPEIGDGLVIMTKEELYEQLGEEVSDFEAVILAGRLTADLTESPGGDTAPS